MMEAEDLHALVEIDQALGHIMQAEKFFVATIQILGSQACALQLQIERGPEPWPDVQQREKSGRVEPTAMAKPRPDDVIVVRRNGFENVQEADCRLNQLIGAANQARRIAIVAALKMFECPVKLKRRALH